MHADAVGSVLAVYLVLAMLTLRGAWRRGGSGVVMVLSAVAFPLAWVAW